PARAAAAGDALAVGASATGAVSGAGSDSVGSVAGAFCAACGFVDESGSGVAVCADIGAAVPMRSAARTVVFGVGSITTAIGGSFSPPSSRLQAERENASAKAKVKASTIV